MPDHDQVDNRLLGSVPLNVGGQASNACRAAFYHDSEARPMVAVAAGNAGVFLVQVGLAEMKVHIDEAAVCEDRITTTALPRDIHGTFKLELVGAPGDPDHFIVEAPRLGGVFTDSFDILHLPETTEPFAKIRATWTVGDARVVHELSYPIQNLGAIFHSQYNTPSEANCPGGASPVCLFSKGLPGCPFTNPTFRSGFADEVDENGSGQSLAHGFVQRESDCRSHGTSAGCGAHRMFRTSASRKLHCGAGSALGRPAAGFADVLRQEKMNDAVDREIAARDAEFRRYKEALAKEEIPEGRFPPNYLEIKRHEWRTDQCRKANIIVMDERYRSVVDSLRAPAGEATTPTTRQSPPTTRTSTGR